MPKPLSLTNINIPVGQPSIVETYEFNVETCGEMYIYVDIDIFLRHMLRKYANGCVTCYLQILFLWMWQTMELHWLGSQQKILIIIFPLQCIQSYTNEYRLK